MRISLGTLLQTQQMDQGQPEGALPSYLTPDHTESMAQLYVLLTRTQVWPY